MSSRGAVEVRAGAVYAYPAGRDILAVFVSLGGVSRSVAVVAAVGVKFVVVRGDIMDEEVAASGAFLACAHAKFPR
jgi:hypothetical protein